MLFSFFFCKWHTLAQCMSQPYKHTQNHPGFEPTMFTEESWGLWCEEHLSRVWLCICIPQNTMGSDYLSMPWISASGARVFIYILTQRYTMSLPCRWDGPSGLRLQPRRRLWLFWRHNDLRLLDVRAVYVYVRFGKISFWIFFMKLIHTRYNVPVYMCV